MSCEQFEKVISFNRKCFHGKEALKITISAAIQDGYTVYLQKTDINERSYFKKMFSNKIKFI